MNTVHRDLILSHHAIKESIQTIAALKCALAEGEKEYKESPNLYTFNNLIYHHGALSKLRIKFREVNYILN